jgi:hypothetical protein
MSGHHQSVVVSSEIVTKNHNPLVDRKTFQTGFLSGLLCNTCLSWKAAPQKNSLTTKVFSAHPDQQ